MKVSTSEDFDIFPLFTTRYERAWQLKGVLASIVQKKDVAQQNEQTQ